MRRAGAANERERMIGSCLQSERPSSTGYREAETRRAEVATGSPLEAWLGLVRPSNPNPIRSVNRTGLSLLPRPDRPGSNTEPRTRTRRGRTASARETENPFSTRDLGRTAQLLFDDRPFSRDAPTIPHHFDASHPHPSGFQADSHPRTLSGRTLSGRRIMCGRIMCNVIGLVSVYGTLDADGSAVENVCVDHGRPDITMSQQGLDGANVRAVFEQMCREGMSEGVGGDSFRNFCSSCGAADGALGAGFCDVMAADDSGSGIARELG